MELLKPFSFISIAIFIYFGLESVEGRKLTNVNEVRASKTITVDLNGKGDFTRVQDAFDSVPENNNQWIHIHINEGTYVEKVTNNRSCIFLTGSSSGNTIISYGDHRNQTALTATFHQYADNFVAKYITFKNTYNHRWVSHSKEILQAVAMNVQGDKVAFYECGFVGFQDTLLDYLGRHYFKLCFIEDWLISFGEMASLYTRKPDPGPGYITAQGRDGPDEPTGFVFKYCVVTTTSEVFLGRAWKGFATVLFYKSVLSDGIVPLGWYAWDYVSKEQNLSLGEHECSGAGSDTTHRVPWEKKFTDSEVLKYVDISFVDKEGWIKQLPQI